MVGEPLAVEVGVTLPHVPLQDRTQFAPLFAGSLLTEAVNCMVEPTSTVAVVLDSDTLTSGGDVDEPLPQLLRIRIKATAIRQKTVRPK